MRDRMEHRSTPKLTPHRARSIAVAAEVDPGTVRRYFEGSERVKPLSRERIERALANLAGRTTFQGAR
jgi:hypothetical protein